MFTMRWTICAAFCVGMCLESVFGTCSRNYADQLLLISMDGFRWDYTHNVDTPNFDRLRDEGVSVDYVNNTFITKTFPCHYSIITGLYEESHGIVGNTFFDPEYNDTFTMRSSEPKWWNGGEPLWVTARKNNLKSGTVFWPGSDVEIRGYRPNTYYPYDESMPFDKRIDIAMDMLKNKKYNLVTIYFHEPDHTGHLYGPDSNEVKLKVKYMDSIVGSILRQLTENGLVNDVNLIVTSDHGMTAIDLNKLIDLSAHISAGQLVRYSDRGPVMHLWPSDDEEEAIIMQLTGLQKNFTVYRKDSIPEFWHYKNNRRVMPVFLVADEGYSLTMNATKERAENELGNHGYDNRLMTMRPIFYAFGPNFQKNLSVTSINSVDIYPLVCKLLGMAPSENNGSLANTEMFVRKSTQDTTCGARTCSMYSISLIMTSIIMYLVYN